MNKTDILHFTHARLSETSHGLYDEFINARTLRSGIYRLAAGTEDLQKPHLEDELYYIISGKSRMLIADESFPANPGDVFYVPAHVEHRFFGIEEDLTILVFFSKMQA